MVNKADYPVERPCEDCNGPCKYDEDKTAYVCDYVDCDFYEQARVTGKDKEEARIKWNALYNPAKDFSKYW